MPLWQSHRNTKIPSESIWIEFHLANSRGTKSGQLQIHTYQKYQLFSGKIRRRFEKQHSIDIRRLFTTDWGAYLYFHAYYSWFICTGLKNNSDGFNRWYCFLLSELFHPIFHVRKITHLVYRTLPNSVSFVKIVNNSDGLKTQCSSYRRVSTWRMPFVIRYGQSVFTPRWNYIEKYRIKFGRTRGSWQSLIAYRQNIQFRFCYSIFSIVHHLQFMQIVCSAGAVAWRIESIVQHDSYLFEKYSPVCANGIIERASIVVGMLCENEHHNWRPERRAVEHSLAYC